MRLIAALLLLSPMAFAAEAPELVPGRLIVKLKSGGYGVHGAAAAPAAALDAISKKAGARSSKPLFEARMGPASAAGPSLAEKFPARARRADPSVAAPDLSQIYVLEVAPDADLGALIRELRKDPSVVYVHPDYVVKANAVFNDPYLTSSGTWVRSAYGPQYNDPMDNYDDLWHLRLIQADKAWDHAQGQGTVIAIVDTGVDYNHPDLAGNLWTNPADGSHGWALDTNNSNFMDTYGHGTHVAGIAAAVGNNGKGIVGVAPQAKIMGIRLDAGARWNTTIMAQGFRWAVDHGADIINHSGGMPVSEFDRTGYGEPGVLIDALNYAAANGVAVVASAGNWGISIQNSDYLPAAYPGVIGVGATDANDHLTSWSNYGSGVLISAPGGNECWAECVAGKQPGEFRLPESIDRHNILSARASGARYPDEITKVTNEYMRVGGTSMSAPVVSGAVALMLSANANLTLAQIRTILAQSADAIPYPGAGAGRLNAHRAVLRAKSLPDAPGQLPRPVISGVTAAPGADALTVTFATDQDAIGVLYLGDAAGRYRVASADMTPRKSHTLTISGLTVDRSYHYMVVARTKWTAARGADAVATTSAGPAPVITNVGVAVSGGDATITWTTDIDADGWVDYGATTAYGSRVSEPAGARKSHSVTLTGLASGTVYHFQVSSKGTGSTGRSPDGTFTSGHAPRTVTITRPAHGSTIPPGATWVEATITEPTGVAFVEFFDNGKKIGFGAQGVQPDGKMSFAWDTWDFAPGETHTITAKAYSPNGTDGKWFPETLLPTNTAPAAFTIGAVVTRGVALPSTPGIDVYVKSSPVWGYPHDYRPWIYAGTTPLPPVRIRPDVYEMRLLADRSSGTGLQNCCAPLTQDQDYSWVTMPQPHAEYNAPLAMLTGPSTSTVVGTATFEARVYDQTGQGLQVVQALIEDRFRYGVYKATITLASAGGRVYSGAWDSKTVDDGIYIVRLRAVQNGGKEWPGGQGAAAIEVRNGAAPPVALTSPGDGSSVTGTITVTAESCDDAAKVELYDGTTLLGVMTPAAN